MIIGISILITACSNEAGDSESSSDQANVNTEEKSSQENSSVSSGTGDGAVSDDSGSQEDASSQNGKVSDVNRKIIYTANLRIEVKNYKKAVNDIQNQVADRGGYIVESNMHGGSEDSSTNGQLTARIPQEQFREFVQLVEDGSSEVLESSISGQDVTEEYVDLESRLKSKRVVEKRLLSFMEQAKKTKDLLTISDDLAKVQGEIEEITGRMNYLENKADLATVTIHIQEKNVTISSINKEDLNTWEKTKQQFMESINILISAFSSLFVFFIGNLPVLIILGAVGLAIFFIIKRRKRSNRE
ncbi:hypothetical protein J2Z82_002609 [Virgibacillus litoralis]|uniref:DUF4349 domain-containing protein n=2 Tax=Virgibacillus litoralis TaxID=578221 RepID=A0ABS4HG18_9BACI|nr:DUF4349 domain-containing protein [Virgibacillus litoralis]MBP1949669.1 hypothetical protein [Virgibacillus litoralis]